jgi:hypothetical protein
MTHLLFKVSNHHSEACGRTTTVDGDAPGIYHGYFTNEHGEQAVYTYDKATGEAAVRMGDTGWDNVHQVVDGKIEGLMLDRAEATWLRACWLASGALKKRPEPAVH